MTVTTRPGTTAQPGNTFTVSGDTDRRAALRRMRIIATGLLVLAALIFVLTLNRDPYSLLGYLNAAAEAAMIGGLADWFAVTALFRHPLAIPIPHTAIIPRKKDGLGRALQTFVTDNFLVPEVFQTRLRNAKIGHRLGEWLSDPQHRARILDEVTKLGGAGAGPDPRRGRAQPDRGNHPAPPAAQGEHEPGLRGGLPRGHRRRQGAHRWSIWSSASSTPGWSATRRSSPT